jgi:hypothetical protein
MDGERVGASVRVALEIWQTPDGRVEGTIQDDHASASRAFSGWLELLSVIENALIEGGG